MWQWARQVIWNPLKDGLGHAQRVYQYVDHHRQARSNDKRG